MRGALDGVKVLVTRPRERSEELTFLLEDEGAKVLHLPLLELLPPQDARPLHSAAEQLHRYAWVVFASSAAVAAFAEAVRQAGTQPALSRARLAAVGAQTAQALVDRGLEVAVTSAGTGAELAAALGPRLHPGDEVLLPCARDARPELTEALDELAASVTRVVAYRSEKLRPSADEAREALAAEVMLFASPRTAEAYLEAAGEGARQALERAAVVAIGPTTAEALGRLGVKVEAVAATPSAEGLVLAAVEVVARRRGR